MDLNSANQTWSKWVFRVTPGRPRAVSVEEMRVNCARLVGKLFGSATRMNVYANVDNHQWVVEVISEGHPIHEKDYVDYVGERMLTLFVDCFGINTVISTKAKLFAGQTADGSPHTQAIILPALSLLSSE